MAVTFPDTPQISDPIDKVANVPRYKEMQRLMAVAGPIELPGELWRPNGVAIDCLTEQIYVAEAWHNFSRVSIFSGKGDKITDFSHKYMNWPLGIGFHRNRVYVTDMRNHFVLKFDVSLDIRFVGKTGGRGSGIGKFNSPGQLAISPNGVVFVTDVNNHRIQILDSRLRYQRALSHHSMKEPCDVKLTPDLVYILSSESPCVHIFSFAGEKLHSLISCGDADMQVTSPYFFCLDAHENLIISDYGASQIKIFSIEGTLLHSEGEEGHGVGLFCEPLGIALTNDLQLVVVSRSTNFGMQIFSCS